MYSIVVRWPSLVATALATTTLLTSCGDSESSAGGTGGLGGSGGSGGSGVEWQVPPKPAFDWSPCPEDGFATMECAAIPVPVDWAQPDGQTLTILTRRIEATEPVRGSLWLLAGGPGAPGTFMLNSAAFLAERHPDLEIFIPDHRGTGGSALLQCMPNTDPPSEECMAGLPQTLLLNTNTTNAALDVAALASWTAPNDNVLLYGASYGTYWAHRTVSLAASVFSGVVLDSPCDAVEGCSSARREEFVDAVGRQFLERCGENASCAAHLPGDPVAFAREVVVEADAGACVGAQDAGVTGVRLRNILTRLMLSEDTRGLVPALLFRYSRCQPQDVQALATVHQYFAAFESVLELIPTYSVPTNYQVTYTEWWDSSFSVADAEAQLNATIVASGAGLRWAQTFSTGDWQAAPSDPSLRSWALGKLPALVLIGGLDLNTAAAAVEANRPEQSPDLHWLTMDYATHVDSVNPEAAYATCARSLISGFLSDPTSSLDDDCIAEVTASQAPILFNVAPEKVVELLGTSSVYGD